MLKSVKELSAIAGTNRETVQKRADQLGLIAIPGDKGAKLYDSRALVQLIPPPTRGGIHGAEAASLEEARIRQTQADADLKELQAEKLRGSLADISEVMEAQNSIFDQLAAIVKKSAMTEVEKEDALSAMSAAFRFWEDQTK